MIENTYRFPGIDRETFDVMWELSAAGSPAEACFLRSRQEEYYTEEAEVQRDPLEFMPDVSSIRRVVQYTILNSSNMFDQVQSDAARLTRPCKGCTWDFFPNCHHRCPSVLELFTGAPLGCWRFHRERDCPAH